MRRSPFPRSWLTRGGTGPGPSSNFWRFYTFARPDSIRPGRITCDWLVRFDRGEREFSSSSSSSPSPHCGPPPSNKIYPGAIRSKGKEKGVNSNASKLFLSSSQGTRHFLKMYVQKGGETFEFLAWPEIMWQTFRCILNLYCGSIRRTDEKRDFHFPFPRLGNFLSGS